MLHTYIDIDMLHSQRFTIAALFKKCKHFHAQKFPTIKVSDTTAAV